jgi:transcription elongation factor
VDFERVEYKPSFMGGRTKRPPDKGKEILFERIECLKGENENLQKRIDKLWAENKVQRAKIMHLEGIRADREELEKLREENEELKKFKDDFALYVPPSVHIAVREEMKMFRKE